MNSARRRLSIRCPVVDRFVELPMLMRYSYGELTMGRSKNGLDIRCVLGHQPAVVTDSSRGRAIRLDRAGANGPLARPDLPILTIAYASQIT